MRPIAISLSPNVTKKDVFIALSYVFFPWKWFSLRKGKYVEKAANKFATYMGVNKAYMFGSGRGALFSILQCCNFNKGDEVILQAYTCVVVPNAVIWNGLKPVYADIEEHTLNMNPEDVEKKITPKTKAIIIQHTMGKPAKIEQLLAIAKKYNLKVIEDCAIALGAEYKGKKVGTFGDAALFSFGRDKIISSVHGGAAIFYDIELEKRVANFQKSFPHMPIWEVVKYMLHPVIFSLFVLPFYNIQLGKVFLVLSQKLKLINKVFSSGEKKSLRPTCHPCKYPNSLAQIGCHQIGLIDYFNEHRRNIAKMYTSKIKEKDIAYIAEEENEKCIYMRYPLLTKKAFEIQKYAKSQKILLGDWYNQVIAPAGVNEKALHYIKGSCPVAEKVIGLSVNLPTYIGIKEKEVGKIMKCLNY